MKGTDKQIAWAEEIKANINTVYTRTIALMEKMATENGASADKGVAMVNARMDALNNHEYACDIISCFKDVRLTMKEDDRSVAADFARLNAAYNMRTIQRTTEKNLLCR